MRGFDYILNPAIYELVSARLWILITAAAVMIFAAIYLAVKELLKK